MDEIVAGLNKQQSHAVTSTATVLQVLAPPGSGKTKTLTSRVAWHIAHEKLRPWDIIVCTFTRKAAGEMKERIRSFVGEDLEKKLVLGTFHSICMRYLRRYGQYIGLNRNFMVLDSDDCKAIIKRLIKKHGFSSDLSRAGGRISRRKASLQCVSNSNKPRKVEDQEFEQLFQMYQDELASSHSLDYDDLLLKCVQLFADHPECVANIQAVLIDEFQDTNHVQYELMTLIARKISRENPTAKITIVGDPDQSIYSFRNVEIENLNRMQTQYSGTEVVHLEENYRSSACILRAADKIIEQDLCRPKKSMQSTKSSGPRPMLRKHPFALREAEWLVDEVQRLHNMSAGLLSYSDFAILLRVSHHGAIIEPQLGRRGIPYRVVGGPKFFDRQEIRILLDYLKVVAQPSHPEALLRIVNVPSRGIGDTTMQRIVQLFESQSNAGTSKASSTNKPKDLWHLIREISKGEFATKLSISNQAQRGLDEFVGIILSLQKKLESMTDEFDTLDHLLDFLIKKLNFKKFLEEKITKTKEELETRLENIEELRNQACSMAMSSYDESQGLEQLPTLEDVEQRNAAGARAALCTWLGNISLATSKEDDKNAPTERLTISTIHSAKGLEWPVVFIPSAYEGIIPHSNSKDTDEERRLLYVAMTRAKALLYLSWPLSNSPPVGERGYTAMENPNEGHHKASSFLTHSTATNIFSKTSLTIDDALVTEIADILGRGRPSEEKLYETFLKYDQCNEKEEYGKFERDLALKEAEEKHGRGKFSATQQSSESYVRGRYKMAAKGDHAEMQSVYAIKTTLSTGFTSAATLSRDFNRPVAQPEQIQQERKAKPKSYKASMVKHGQLDLTAFGFTSKPKDEQSDTAAPGVPSPVLTMPSVGPIVGAESASTIKQTAPRDHPIHPSVYHSDYRDFQTSDNGTSVKVVQEHIVRKRIRYESTGLGKKRSRELYEPGDGKAQHILISSSPMKQRDPEGAKAVETDNTVLAIGTTTNPTTAMQTPGNMNTGFMRATTMHMSMQVTTMDRMNGSSSGSNGKPPVKRRRYGMR